MDLFVWWNSLKKIIKVYALFQYRLRKIPTASFSATHFLKPLFSFVFLAGVPQGSH